MKQVVLITGANGMLAKQLAKQLAGEYSVRFLTRKKTRSNEYLWDLNTGYIDPDALLGVNVIIHLAGASIADKRWTSKRKQTILSSRVASAELILKELKKHQISIDLFISASAIGYYGTKTSDAIFDEESPKGDDFLSDVCGQWEDVADRFKLSGVVSRIAILRVGIILAKNDGALKKIIQPIKYGLGSALGTGNQYMPWIHIQDLVRIFKYVLDEKNISGIFNAVSPQHINNVELTKTIAKQLNKPLLLPKIPKVILRGIFGEMATMLVEGSRVSSEKLLRAGFKFRYEKFSEALKSLV
jgi:uncharacterized protein (TIGR01777 family)